MYGDNIVERVRFIRRAIRFGFSLSELSRFLTARENGKPPCHVVRATAARILGDLEQQIAELTAARDSIQMTLTEWDRRLAEMGPGSPARLLESLSDDVLGFSMSRARGPSGARDHRPAGS
jgi:DNA-binding transcriptional MerR regulator